MSEQIDREVGPVGGEEIPAAAPVVVGGGADRSEAQPERRGAPTPNGRLL